MARIVSQLESESYHSAPRGADADTAVTAKAMCLAGPRGLVHWQSTSSCQTPNMLRSTQHVLNRQLLEPDGQPAQSTRA